MPKASLFIVAFLVVLIAGDRLLALTLGGLMSQSRNRYVEFYEGRNEADILILGNSRADRHFVAKSIKREVGARTLNLGIGGVSMVSAEALLRDYVDRYGVPKLVVLEPSCLTTDPAVIGDMRLYGVYSPRIRELERRYAAEFYYAARVFHLIRFNNEMFFRVAQATVQEPKDRAVRNSIGDAALAVIGATAPFAFKNHPENEDALRRVTEFAEERGIELRIALTPFLPELARRIQNLSSWTGEVSALSGDSHVWDYSAAVSDRALFSDGVHLNAEGTEVLLEAMLSSGFYEPAINPERGVPQPPARP